MKNLIIISALLTLAACQCDQTPGLTEITGEDAEKSNSFMYCEIDDPDAYEAYLEERNNQE